METRCPQCGAEQPPGEEWKQKPCPACLMKLGLSGAISAEPLPDTEDPRRESEPQAERSLGAAGSNPAMTAQRRRLPIRWSWLWAAYLAGGAAVLALVLIAVRHLTEKPESPGVVRFLIGASNDMNLEDFAVSPDGRRLAYTAGSVDGNTLLWLRPVDQLEPRELQGTEGAAMPFWSPDSQWIGFFAENKLKKIRVDGSPAMNIANAEGPSGGTWSASGRDPVCNQRRPDCSACHRPAAKSR